MENLRVDALESTGLGHDAVSADNARGMSRSATGFGSAAGAAFLGYDCMVQAVGSSRGGEGRQKPIHEPLAEAIVKWRLDDLAARVFRLSGYGAPALVKLLNNALGTYHLTATARMLNLAESQGFLPATSGRCCGCPPGRAGCCGWRIPFLCGLLLVGVGLYIRLRIEETPAFVAQQETTAPPANGLRVLLAQPGRVLQLALIWGGPGLTFSFYLIAVFGLSHLTTTVGMSAGQAFLTGPRDRPVSSGRTRASCGRGCCGRSRGPVRPGCGCRPPRAAPRRPRPARRTP